MKKETEIRSYLKTVVEKINQMKLIFPDYDEDKKDSLFYQIQFHERVRETLQWVLDEYP